ncbi:nitroreductase family protein [Levilactobacillus namurensis]|uniref:nitroreductase family protein n=1 Tax=Levilactobacillus namurensis TaxID=380393 RepID=UPI001E022762|nr:nitroreductase family protein [Levilactobacillus namurensis]HJE45715.1 nitroreductase family protein [Levilactobacillus namurensis]
MKKVVKKILPKKWVIKYREIREHNRVKKEFLQDARAYNQSTNFNLVGSSDKGVMELLIFHSHALEKGLSHPNFRPNFGKNALFGLKNNLDEYEKLGLSKDNFAYINAISVLKSYKSKHNVREVETPFFDSLFNGYDIEDGSEIAGAEEYINQDTTSMNFSELEYYRTTQRQFLNKPVQLDDFKKVVDLALKTPSVCNRQPWKVYVTNNPGKISSLLDLQKGYKGYGIPPTLSLVTVDRKAFIGSFERNEAYIDGGLFLMNFDFALTYHGLASCILNSMLPNEQQQKIRDIMDISSSEVLIAFVAAGYPLKRTLTAMSARKPVKDILKVVD